MKKILLISLLIVIANSLTAQKVGNYYTKNLNAYVGTWEYTDADCTFRIYLKKGLSYYNKTTNRLRWEMVYGGHYIERNGVVITDLEAATKLAAEDDSVMSITASNGKEEETLVNPNVLTLGFYDDLKEKGGTGLLTLTPGNPAQLRWQITKTDERVFLTVIGDPEPVFHEGWTVPEDVVLTKIFDTIGPPSPPLPPPGPGDGPLPDDDPFIILP